MSAAPKTSPIHSRRAYFRERVDEFVLAEVRAEKKIDDEPCQWCEWAKAGRREVPNLGAVQCADHAALNRAYSRAIYAAPEGANLNSLREEMIDRGIEIATGKAA